MARKNRKRKAKAREKKHKAREERRLNSPEPIQASKSSNAAPATGHGEPRPTRLPGYPREDQVGSKKLTSVPALEQPAKENNATDWRFRRRRIWRDFRNGMLVTVLLLGLKLTLANSWFVSQFQLMAYNFIQSRLAATVSTKDLPVAVVDISDIGLVDTDIRGRQATPRGPLRQLLATIAEQSPVAIGIDIDFSPDNHGLLFPDDPKFFKYCLSLHSPRNAHIPVFLGVHRSEMLRPEQWLDSEEFQELAASIAVPPEPRKMVEAISVMNSVRPLPAMSAALAKAYRRGRPASELPGWMFHRVSEGSSSPDMFHVQQFPVDFGPLEVLEDQTLAVNVANATPTLALSPKHPLSGKMVLLGNAIREKAFDQFYVPLQSEPKPGIYLHASAAYTLAAKPLFELTVAGGVSLDFLLATAVFLTIVFIRLYYYKKTQRQVATRSLEIVLLLMLASAILLVGIWFVHRTRVIWEDSILVALVLLAHTWVADLIHWIRRVLGGAWNAGVFEPQKESDS